MLLRSILTAAILLAASLAQAAPQVPADAVAMALADASQLAPEVATQRRYLWAPSGTKADFAAAAVTINTAISQSNVDVIPTTLAGGHLLAVDLRLCAPDDAGYQRLKSLWASLADRDPYFHVLKARKRIAVKPFRAADGKTYSHRFVATGVAAPHLGPAALELESAIGNPLPEDQSFAPVLRLDWFIREVLSTADGGRYYDFRGLTVGQTTLETYLVSRGASQQQAKRLDSDERAAFVSRVTGKARAVTIFQGAGTRASVGPAIVAITDDPFDDTVDAQFDPFRELLDAKTNGHEVFVTLPSGWLEYTIWDGQQRLVAEAPPNLVSDHRVPEPYTARLQGAISCMRCHAPADQWQPFVNEVAHMLGGRLNVFGDANSRDDLHETLRRLAGLYSGDLGHVVTAAQDSFARRTQAVCGMEPGPAVQAVANLFDAYEYEMIDAAKACREIGFDLDAGDALGVATFRRVVPGQTPEDPIVGRLAVDYLDPQAGQRVGLRNTRRQFELIYADLMLRAIPALLEQRKKDAQK